MFLNKVLTSNFYEISLRDDILHKFFKLYLRCNCAFAK